MSRKNVKLIGIKAEIKAIYQSTIRTGTTFPHQLTPDQQNRIIKLKRQEAEIEAELKVL